jgi:protein TonB
MAAAFQASPHRGLIWALGVSVAVHAALVGFRFAAPEAYNRVFQDTPLEVILVNSQSAERPTDAQALAQVPDVLDLPAAPVVPFHAGESLEWRFGGIV